MRRKVYGRMAGRDCRVATLLAMTESGKGELMQERKEQKQSSANDLTYTAMMI
jgi:hypothetical protein